MDHDSYYYASSYQDEDEDDFNDESNESKNEMSGDALLISLVRDHPYLYNKELTDFKDSIKKQNAWVEIANIMNMTGTYIILSTFSITYIYYLNSFSVKY